MSKRIMVRMGLIVSVVVCFASDPALAGVYVNCSPDSVMFPLPTLTGKYENDLIDSVPFNGYGCLNDLRLSNPSTLFCLPEVDDEVAVAFGVWFDVTVHSEDSIRMEGWEDDVELWAHIAIVSGTEATYLTELTHLEFSVADSQIRLRESPTLASLGQYIVTDLSVGGGSGCDVEGFFDVFFELSLDNGSNWIPADGPGRMVLIPEPTSLSLLAPGGLPFGVLALIHYCGRNRFNSSDAARLAPPPS